MANATSSSTIFGNRNNSDVVMFNSTFRRNKRVPLDQSSVFMSYTVAKNELTNSISPLYDGQLVSILSGSPNAPDNEAVPYIVVNPSRGRTSYEYERIVSFSYLLDTLKKQDYIRKFELGYMTRGVGKFYTYVYTAGVGYWTDFGEIFNDYANNSAGPYGHAEGYHTYAGNYAHAEGYHTTARGDYSHAEGVETMASGIGASAQGKSTTASGTQSHAEGLNSISSGIGSHAEGSSTNATGDYAHSEGTGTGADGNYSHAEGVASIVAGEGAHGEGKDTKAQGNYSHAEGQSTTTNGVGAHAEGHSSSTNANYAHAEGEESHANAIGSHSEGYKTTVGAGANYGHAEGSQTSVSGLLAHAEGLQTSAQGIQSHAEGKETSSTGAQSHSEGSSTEAKGDSSHAEGEGTSAGAQGSHAEGNATRAQYAFSHAEGENSIAGARGSHAEGQLSYTKGNYSHAEGSHTKVEGNYGHAEGFKSYAIGLGSHAEGSNTSANGFYSHSEGINTVAGANYSHAAGIETTATGEGSDSRGYKAAASGSYSSASGENTKAIGRDAVATGNTTEASGQYSTAIGSHTRARNTGEVAIGTYNISYLGSGSNDLEYLQYCNIFQKNSGPTVFTIGNGTADGNRRNIYAIHQNGDSIKTEGVSYYTNEVYAPLSYSYVDSLGITAYLNTVLRSLFDRPKYHRPTVGMKMVGVDSVKFFTSSQTSSIQFGSTTNLTVAFRAAYVCPDFKDYDSHYDNWLSNRLGYSTGVTQIVFKYNNGTGPANLATVTYNCAAYSKANVTATNNIGQSYKIATISGLTYGISGQVLQKSKTNDTGIFSGRIFSFNATNGVQTFEEFADQNAYIVGSNLYADTINLTLNANFKPGAERTYTLCQLYSYKFNGATQMYFQQIGDKGTYIPDDGFAPTNKFGALSYQAIEFTTWYLQVKQKYYYGVTNSDVNSSFNVTTGYSGNFAQREFDSAKNHGTISEDIIINLDVNDSPTTFWVAVPSDHIYANYATCTALSYANIDSEFAATDANIRTAMNNSSYACAARLIKMRTDGAFEADTFGAVCMLDTGVNSSDSMPIRKVRTANTVGSTGLYYDIYYVNGTAKIPTGTIRAKIRRIW